MQRGLRRTCTQPWSRGLARAFISIAAENQLIHVSLVYRHQPA
ncbi:hypothetical protein E2C01_057467 [Portunus trituberculatus]|uniref:Uncharacterized protein n=1 Tax=Portunus trituberculatus TaxID=210409 RepID=A0A5B7H0E8_PORTR|nr:hypothetical protein [Portunus trituberculatus]